MVRAAVLCVGFLFAVPCGCAGTTHAVTPPAAGGAAGKKPEGCGGYRFGVKVATDPTAAQIHTSPKDATIASLIALSAPSSPPADARANAVEKQIYRVVNVRLANIHRESDRDLHLVIEDSSARTMIVESPDPLCAPQSPFAREMESVRTVLTSRYGTDPNLNPGTIVSVEGVGFFDFFHSQLGQARNGIELHPITSICFGVNCSLP